VKRGKRRTSVQGGGNTPSKSGGGQSEPKKEGRAQRKGEAKLRGGSDGLEKSLRTSGKKRGNRPRTK